MILKTGLLAIALFLAAICAGPVLADPQASPVVSRQKADDLQLPPDLGLPSYINDKKVPLSEKEKKAVALANTYSSRNVLPYLTDAGRVTYVYGQTQPSVVCAPFMASDIELQAGELINDVVLGDSARWKVVIARSGNPSTPHVIVKPMDAGLETIATVTTDRRTYHIRLVSQNSADYTAYIGFTYPEETELALQEQLKKERELQQHNNIEVPGQTETADISKLDFGYSIDGSAPWKPLQVYNDGRQTVLKLPPSVNQSELPVLLVRRDGEDQMTNFRFRDGALVVDQVFQEAVLLTGVGSNQRRVTIKHNNSK